MAVPSELLLLVFLHGFKGGADTFASFPDRLATVLSASQQSTQVESVVYPPYDTRGELIAAVDNHVEWLTSLVVERQAAYKEKGGTGPVRVVLLGHSMGGLVIADALLQILKAKSPWPSVLGLIAYDTPYWGLNPSVFRNATDKVLGYAQQGQAVFAAVGLGWGALSALRGNGAVPAPASGSSTSSRSGTPPDNSKPSPPSGSRAVAPSTAPPTSNASMTPWMLAAGAAAVIGAAGTAYWQRDTLTTSLSWATSHLSFVGELWSPTNLEARLEAVFRAKDVGFHCFYTLLPNTKLHPSTSRTFILVPRAPFGPSFTPNQNYRATDEIQAHVEMFTDKSDGMYSLGSETCGIIGGWLEDARSGRPVGGSRGEEEPVRLV